MIELKIDDVSFDELSQMGIVLLVEQEGKLALPIWVGMFEAQAILIRLQNSVFPRPLTHDLLKNCIEQLGGEVEYIVINEIIKNTFYAKIRVKAGDRELSVDSRPSDAIALAVRNGAPIYAEEEIFRSSCVDREKFKREQKERIYKAYLESLEEDDTGKFKH